MNMIEAARSGDLETVKKLAVSGSNIHADDDSALRWAAYLIYQSQTGQWI
jgi:hypothetical protein